jgi:ABC-type phosphate transport system substrate-binding protein
VRIWKTMVAAGAIAAATTALAVAPASAEPINPLTGKVVVPAAYDIVGVGSQSITYVVGQLTYNYDKGVGRKHSPTNPYIYSWDAVPPSNLNNTTQMIVVKQGCKKNLRPDGSSAGIGALTTYGTTTYSFAGKKHVVPCIDYARSSRPRKSTDPVFGKGGVAFVALGGDAVTYATTKGSNAPNNLTRAQLIQIFGCTVPAKNGFPVNTWGALLGKGAKGASQKIDPILPQAGSGTLSFWATTALGLSSTNEPSCGSAASLPVTKQPEENEGTNSIFLAGGKPDVNVIYPYSIGAWLSQSQSSAKCFNAGCNPVKGVTCKPSKTQNKFGCNQTGVLLLNGIAGTKPSTGPKGHMVTNPAWKNTPFQRTLYDVVNYASAGDHIPGYLEKWLGRKGYFCTNPKVLVAYGFEQILSCGFAS